MGAAAERNEEQEVYLERPPCFDGSSVHSGFAGREDLQGFGSVATADEGASQ